MSTELEIAWAAGLFDGEGCIHIGKIPPTSKNGLRNPSYRLTLKITMGCQVSVRKFAELVGDGTSFLHSKGGKRLNPSYSFIAQSRKAQPILQQLRPYLITKADQADIALTFLALPDCPRGGKNGSRQVSSEYLQVRQELYEACAKAKPTYRFR